VDGRGVCHGAAGIQADACFAAGSTAAGSAAACDATSATGSASCGAAAAVRASVKCGVCSVKGTQRILLDGFAGGDG